MKKLAFCLVLLALSTITFVGCQQEKAKPKGVTTPPTTETKTGETTKPAETKTDTTPAAPSTETPAEPAK
jgi:hypothetical protein